MSAVLRSHDIDLRAFHKATRKERQAMLDTVERRQVELAGIRDAWTARNYLHELRRQQQAAETRKAECREILELCKRRARRLEAESHHVHLTPYARALVNSIGRTPERVEDVIAAARHFTGPRGPGLTYRKEDEDLFTTAYYFGSQLAAGNPRRPLDRSGITKPKT